MNTRRWRFDARRSDPRLRREYSSLDIAPLKISVCGIEELAGQCEAGSPRRGLYLQERFVAPRSNNVTWSTVRHL